MKSNGGGIWWFERCRAWAYLGKPQNKKILCERNNEMCGQTKNNREKYCTGISDYVFSQISLQATRNSDVNNIVISWMYCLPWEAWCWRMNKTTKDITLDWSGIRDDEQEMWWWWISHWHMSNLGFCEPFHINQIFGQIRVPPINNDYRQICEFDDTETNDGVWWRHQQELTRWMIVGIQSKEGERPHNDIDEGFHYVEGVQALRQQNHQR